MSSNGNKNICSLNGYFRNLCFFAGVLSDVEINSLFVNGIQDGIDFPSEYDNGEIVDLLKTSNFYLGLLGIYNVSNINILNCVMKYDGRAYSVK